MPACKVGCCPDDICNCSNDCECLLPDDTLGVVYENPFLFTGHALKANPDVGTHTICPCRTKEELADYVRPIEPRLDCPMESHKDDTNSTKVQDCLGGVDNRENEGGEKDASKGSHNHAPHAPKTHLSGDVNLNRSDDESCERSHPPEELRKDSGDEKNCEVEALKPTHEHSHSAEKDCCKGEFHNHAKPTGDTCCSDENCGSEKLSESYSKKPSFKESPSVSRCQTEELPRQNSLPSNLQQRTSSPPNSPRKIARAPNFELKPSYSFDSPAPYRKTRRSQSLAEARLGSLLSERRPSCFQLSSSLSRSGRLPDPHCAHGHHHAHECHHGHYGYHYHHSNHHHHDNHDGHHHHDNDHHNAEGNCCGADHSKFDSQVKSADQSCCSDSKCKNGTGHTTHEEVKPLLKREGSKINVEDLVVRTTKLRVQNMCCPKEAQIVRDELLQVEGIQNIRVNVIGRVVHVVHFAELCPPNTLMTILNKRHLGVSIVDTGSQAEAEKGLPRALKIRLVNVAVQVALLGVALAGLFTSSSWYMWVAIVEICFGIVPVLKKASRSMRNFEIDLNILITITVIGTLAIQEWIEGAAVVFVFTLAGFLQRYCFYRVQKTISGLMLSQPSKAVMACTGECIPVENVPIGSIIAVRQGELIPLDGIVVKGVASVDESSLSGEATPVEKILESPAYSGTVIQNGYLEIETTSSSTTSTISKISAMVEDAQMNVSPTEIVVNKFARFYTPLVILGAALVFLIPLFLGLAGVEAYEGGAKTWGERALIVLVTACPCALLMATPTVVICGINGAARLGALIKGGTYLEALGQLTLLAFDKTGTLTEGKFQVVDLIPADNADESDVLRWAAALESKSSHPLAAAVVNEFTGECVSDFVADSDVLPDVSDFVTMEGQGIRGVVEGHEVQVGNKSLVEKLGITLSPKFESAYISFCTDAKTVIFVCVDGELALMISLADTIRWESRGALTWLQDLGVHLCMLTGDAKQTANAVQKELKLDSCVSDMKPDDKLNWITHVKEQNNVRQRRFNCFRTKQTEVVGMVGDGVNDGPALAASDVGIAMAAGGSALAVEAAGVALMNNSVLKVPEMICLSRFCRRIILQNIILSVVLKLVFVIVALTGFVRVWMAVLADLVGLISVILNGLRPLKWQPPRTKRKSEPPRASFRRKRPLLMFETVV